MAPRKSKDSTLYVRVTDETKRKFFKVTAKFGGPSDVLRELVIAFVEGRVTVSPPTLKESIYNVPRAEN